MHDARSAAPIGRRLADALTAEFLARGDPLRAAGQQRYMRSAMPFHGLTVPQVRAVVNAVVTAHPLADRDDWLASVRTVWDGATHREDRYGALALLRHRRFRPWAQTADEALIGLLRYVITSGAWWDLVDDASHAVGDLLRAEREVMTPLLRSWSREPDLWLRRSAIISQLGARTHTDTRLLAFCIKGSLDDPDFFARKAIGWALREYAKTDAAWVRRFLDANAAQVSTLSRREALKWLERTR